MMKRLLHLLVLAFVCLAPAAAAGGGDAPVFPEISGWKFSPPPGSSVYTPDNLWDIIDGAAESFLSYGFEELRIGEYVDWVGTDVRVELYRHSSAENAFGIYAAERTTDVSYIDIGTQGYVDEMVLNFFAGKYYVKISSHVDMDTGITAMTTVARRVAEHLKQPAEWPPALAQFPRTGMLPYAEGYVAQNFLGYSVFQGAFTARYEEGRTLFSMKFESGEKARRAAEGYIKGAGIAARLPDGEIVSVNDPHNGAILILLTGRHIAGLLGGDGKPSARALLESFRKNLVD
jgi:hypothetical protein